MNVRELLDRAHRLNEELRQINEQLGKASLVDLVTLVAADIRPEAITVWEEGQKEATVLLRSPKTPEFAFVVLGKGTHSTQWELSLKLENGDSSRTFCLQCGCCSDELIGLTPPEQKEAVDAWRNEQRARFAAKMEDTCVAHGIKTIFVRKATRWQEKYGTPEGVKVYEADKCHFVMSDMYGRNDVNTALSFLGKGTNIL